MMSVSLFAGDNDIISRVYRLVNTKPNIFCIVGQFIPFGGFDIRKVLVGRGRLQRRSYFFDFLSVGYYYVFVHNFIIAKKTKKRNKSIDNRTKRVYDIRVIDIW